MIDTVITRQRGGYAKNSVVSRNTRLAAYPMNQETKIRHAGVADERIRGLVIKLRGGKGYKRRDKFPRTLYEVGLSFKPRFGDS